MEFDKNSPIYLQIVFEMKRRLITGELHSGDKVPSVRDLANELTVNPNTIVRAYQELERQGITETRRGMGTFIASGKAEQSDELKKEMGLSITKIFIHRMNEAGVNDETIMELINLAMKDKQ